MVPEVANDEAELTVIVVAELVKSEFRVVVLLRSVLELNLTAKLLPWTLGT